MGTGKSTWLSAQIIKTSSAGAQRKSPAFRAERAFNQFFYRPFSDFQFAICVNRTMRLLPTFYVVQVRHSPSGEAGKTGMPVPADKLCRTTPETSLWSVEETCWEDDSVPEQLANGRHLHDRLQDFPHYSGSRLAIGPE
jgi:hypothetical protein